MNEDLARLEFANDALGPEGEAEWQRLQRQLEFADGFWLGFVFSAASLAIAALRQRTERFFAEQRRPMRIVPLATPEAFRAVLPLLFEEDSATAGCVWIEVMGVDPSRATDAGSGPWTAAWDELLLRMNERRDALRRHLGGGLVLVAPPEMKPRTREAAPDLWSVRALVLEPQSVATLQPNDFVPLHEGIGKGFALGSSKETDPDVEFALQEAERIAQRDKVDPRARATALINQGSALYSLGRLPEALARYDEAIALRRRLVESEGRSELTNDLALALMNQGVALRSLDRLPEALARYDEAITFYRQLVEQEGRTELTNNLAMALMNQGVALYILGRLPEALARYDEAITRYRQLVDQEGRHDLSNDLAMVLMNQGNALYILGRLPEALARYDEAIALCERDVAAGMTQFTPDLVKALRIRFGTYGQLGQWDAAAGDVVRALELTKPFLEGDGLAESVRREMGGFVGRLRTLTPEEREQLYEALGEWAKVVRGLVEK